MAQDRDTEVDPTEAEIVREYGPFPLAAGSGIAGVSYDGTHLWFATDDRLHAMDLDSGGVVRTLDVPADAGTAYDGSHLYQIAGAHIHKIDPATGAVLSSIPAPDGSGSNAGLAWADGTLWVGQHRTRQIHQIDPATGAILRTLESNRFVTGVTWVDGELWHGVWEGDDSELRRIDPVSGQVLTRLAMPPGVPVSGIESDGADRLFCGGAGTGKVRVVRRPRRR
jgi:outer membrane protein assembly factor BamB